MSGIVDIKVLLKEMRPVLERTEYVFCTKECFELDDETVALQPIAMFLESEGMSLIISKDKADEVGLAYEGVFHKITLEIHSSLEAVGLTAAFAKVLTEQGVSANVVAGYYHDHIFVPCEKADVAMDALLSLTRS